MTKEQEYIIKLSKAAVFDEQPQDAPKGLDWEYIWNKASEQNIAGLLASAILKLPEDQQPCNKGDWQDVMLETMFVMGKKFAEFERMTERLKNEGIIPICLKGIVIKDLYPTPELRTMGDFDIWVDDEQRKKIENAFTSEGYSLSKLLLLTEADGKNTHWEIFVTLGQEFKTDTKQWEDDIRQHTYTNKNELLTLEAEYHLAYMIIHTEKHFSGKGSGIRNILDIALFLRKNPQIKIDVVSELCRKKGIERFYLYIVAVMKKWFDITLDIKTDGILDDDYFMECVLGAGVFGISMPGNAFKIVQSQQNVSFVRALFPTAKELRNRYTFLNKRSWLLPVAWVHRLFWGAFVKKNNPVGAVKAFTKNREAMEDTKKRLTKLGLDNESQENKQ